MSYSPLDFVDFRDGDAVEINGTEFTKEQIAEILAGFYENRSDYDEINETITIAVMCARRHSDEPGDYDADVLDEF
jgi:uncharacterized protein involved in tellurium resistance